MMNPSVMLTPTQTNSTVTSPIQPILIESPSTSRSMPTAKRVSELLMSDGHVRLLLTRKDIRSISFARREKAKWLSSCFSHGWMMILVIDHHAIIIIIHPVWIRITPAVNLLTQVHHYHLPLFPIIITESSVSHLPLQLVRHQRKLLFRSPLMTSLRGDH